MLVFAVGSVLTAAALASWSRVQLPLGSNSVSRVDTASAIAEYIQRIGDKYDIAGLSLVVVQRNESDWTQDYFGYGIENSRRVAVDRNVRTRFSIASNSKFFTYHSVALLIENGTTIPSGEKLSWTTKVKDVIPEWKLQDQYASDHITILDLLSHRSGLPRHDNSHQHNQTPAQTVSRLQYHRSSYEIREQWQYNNHAYDTLGYIVTLLSGVEYYEYATEHILKPVGLHNTTFNGTEAAESGRLADSFVRSGFNMTQCALSWKENNTIDRGCLGESKPIGWWTKSDGLLNAAAGGIVTTASDSAKWIRELLDPKVIPQHIVDKGSIGISLASGQTPFPEVGVIAYSVGQTIHNYRGYNLVSHGGSLPGQSSLLVRVPDLDFGLTIWNNDDVLGAVINNIVTSAIVEIVAGLEPTGFEDKIISSALQEPILPDAPAHPNPPPSESEVVGRYEDPAYGPFNVSRMGADNALASLLPLNTTGPVYLAQTHSLFISGVVFTHWSGPVFNWTAGLVYPAIDEEGKETSDVVITLVQSGSAYLDGTGIGFFGNWWGQDGDRPIVHASEDLDNVPTRAEAWLEKV